MPQNVRGKYRKMAIIPYFTQIVSQGEAITQDIVQYFPCNITTRLLT